MDFLKSMDICASGMAAQRLRMNVISSNLANINSTKTADGGPYRRRDVIFTAKPVETEFGKTLQTSVDRQLRQVTVSGIQQDRTPFRTVYNPGHPQADENGYIQMPNVDMIKEMANMIEASRAYEANLSVMSTSKSMAQKALDLIR